MRLTFTNNIIWIFIIILAIIILMLVIYLKVLRNNIRVTFKNNQKYTAFVEQLLVEFLFAEEPGVLLSKHQLRILKAFNNGMKSKRIRKIMTATFLQLRQDISGNMIETLYKLYDKVGLLKFALKKLRSKKWNIVALAIKDLRNFRIKKVQDKVKKFINHPRPEVRREAHMYFVELFGYEGLSFLDDLKQPISEWDQILYLDIIEDIGSHNIGDLTKWLKSENDYVVLFVLNIVKVFSRLETKDILLDLLHHSNEEIRLKTIKIITYFEIIEAKKILMNKEKELTLEETILFFSYLEKTATKNDALFVVKYTNHDNFEIKHKALRILQQVDLQLYNRLEKVSKDEAYNKIINFLDVSYGF